MSQTQQSTINYCIYIYITDYCPFFLKCRDWSTEIVLEVNKTCFTSFKPKKVEFSLTKAKAWRNRKVKFSSDFLKYKRKDRQEMIALLDIQFKWVKTNQSLAFRYSAFKDIFKLSHFNIQLHYDKRNSCVTGNLTWKSVKWENIKLLNLSPYWLKVIYMIIITNRLG